MIELWDLLDTPPDERKRFEHVTSLISSSVDEVLRQGSLGVDIIEQVAPFFLKKKKIELSMFQDYCTFLLMLNIHCYNQVELQVQSLNVLKASKMKELVLKRQNELEEIYRGVHIDVNSDAARQILINLIESGSTK